MSKTAGDKLKGCGGKSAYIIIFPWCNLFSFNALSDSNQTAISDLKRYCETTKNPMAKGSVACKVADGKQSLNELCDSLVKSHLGNARKLREVVSHYSMCEHSAKQIREKYYNKNGKLKLRLVRSRS